jgi:hypothetical protein
LSTLEISLCPEIDPAIVKHSRHNQGDAVCLTPPPPAMVGEKNIYSLSETGVYRPALTDISDSHKKINGPGIFARAVDEQLDSLNASQPHLNVVLRSEPTTD